MEVSYPEYNRFPGKGQEEQQSLLRKGSVSVMNPAGDKRQPDYPERKAGWGCDPCSRQPAGYQLWNFHREHAGGGRM